MIDISCLPHNSRLEITREDDDKRHLSSTTYSPNYDFVLFKAPEYTF